MGVSPSAPSQSVRMLEKKLDVRLLHRTTRSVSATEEGRRLGVPQRKVRQFDGWQGIDVDGLRLAFTPTRHFSGRGIGDGNRTLRGSRAIADGERRRFFSGDSGYFDGFAEIGRRFGPFDPTLTETGAYDAHWSYVHMHPAQTVQAHRDLRGRGLLPIHNGTSGLAMHPWHDPFDAMLRIAEAQGVAAATAVMGERIDLDAPHAGERWGGTSWPREPARADFAAATCVAAMTGSAGVCGNIAGSTEARACATWISVRGRAC